jgi:hypothetical protein
LAILSAILLGVTSGVVAAMSWFNRTKHKMYDLIEASKQKVTERVNLVETQVILHRELHAKTTTQLALIQNNQDHLSLRMEDLRETTDKMDGKLDKVLSEVRRDPHRRG